MQTLQLTSTTSPRKLTISQNQNVLEIGFDIALKRAEELDRYYQERNKTVGPLHGLPVSMKDQWHIKGLGTSMAYVGWIDTFEGHRGTGKEKNFESELIRELYSLGAIPIAKVGDVMACPFNAAAAC